MATFSLVPVDEAPAPKQGGTFSLVPVNEPQEPKSTADEVFVRNLAQGITFNTADEIASGLQGAYDAVTQGKSFGDAYNQRLQQNRQQDATGVKERPLTAMAGQATGMIAQTAAMPTAMVSSAAKTVGGRIAGNAARGFVQGAAQGFGAGEGGFQNRAENSVKAGAIGGVTGGVASGVVDTAVGAARNVKGAWDIVKNARIDPADLAQPEVLAKTYKDLSGAAKDLGALVRPEAAQPMLTKAGAVLEGLKPSDAPKAFEIYDDLQQLAKGAVDINDVDTLLKRINLHINGGTSKLGDMTPDAAILSQMKSGVRQFLNDVDPAASLTNATPEAIEGFKKARQVWQQKLKLDDVQHLYKMATNPATGKVDAQLLRNEAGKLWRNETKAGYSSYTPEELGQLFEVARTGKISDAGSFLYNRLPKLAREALPNVGIQETATLGRAGKFAKSVSDSAEKTRMEAGMLKGDLVSAKTGGKSALDAELQAIGKPKAQAPDPRAKITRTPPKDDTQNLRLDTASRMQRAREMGFDVENPVYHGTKADFDSFDPSKSISEKYVFLGGKETANIFAERGGNTKGGNVIPAYIRGPQKEITVKGYDSDILEQEAKKAISEGYSVLKINGINEGYVGKPVIEPQYMVFDPKNVRSVNAKFDPTKKDSDNILSARPEATLAAITLAGGLPLADFISSLEVSRKYGPPVPSQDAWAYQPRDVQNANTRAQQLDEANRIDEYRQRREAERAQQGQQKAPPQEVAPASVEPAAGPAPQQQTQVDPIDAYLDRKMMVESSGKANAKARTSSAAGLFQYTTARWLEVLPKAAPELVKGKSPDQLLKLRFDPKVSRKVARYDTENELAPSLQKAGIPVTPTTLYLAHFLGETGARKLLTAKIGTPIEHIIDKGAIERNASVLKGKKAEDILRWAMKKMGG